MAEKKRIILMRHSGAAQISSLEKIIASLSYCTMGIIGLIWILFAYFIKKRLKYFLMYNIAQSMIIAVFLAILKFFSYIFMSAAAKIPFIDILAIKLSLILQIKIIKFPLLGGMAFSLPEIFVYLLILYITAGVIFGRIFYIPFLTDIMTRVMKAFK